MESICTYLKTTLPAQAHRHEETILKQALQFEFEGKLQLFETEYKVIDELNARFSMDMPVDIESLTATLRKNNSALVEQLAICFGSIISLQQQVDTLQEQVLSQQQVIARYGMTISIRWLVCCIAPNVRGVEGHNVIFQNHEIKKLAFSTLKCLELHTHCYIEYMYPVKINVYMFVCVLQVRV